jgi:MoaA/NifB/PqqE/SkfB family radical SAM enzyme
MDVHELRTIEFEPEIITSTMETLRSIEINIADACNRSCETCPHSIKEYKDSVNVANMFTPELAKVLNKHLKEIDYRGQISLTGFGEPLLNKNLEKIAEEITKDISLGWLEISTNGDALTRKRTKQLVDSGVTHITISLYDEDTTKKFIDELGDLDFELSFKHMYAGYDLYVNRVEQIKDPKNYKFERRCNFPFSRMMLDYNGNACLCANDWRRVTNFGNIVDKSIFEIWHGPEYTQYRKMLMENQRSISPCLNCDINGSLYGNASFEYFKKLQ